MSPARPPEGAPSRFIDAARLHADTVLAEARDHWGPYPTPLLADGLHVDSREPVTWLQGGRTWVLSNPSSQQTFLRLLCGLGALTGASEYPAAAREIVGYTLRNLRLGPLLWWGAHCSADLLHNKMVFCTDGSPSPRHELEGCFPFYALMHEVDAAETRRVIEGFWELHLSDWRVLSFNRHNVANLPRPLPAPGAEPGASGLWDQPYTGDAFESAYFTFMPAGIDLAYAAAELARFSDDPRPLSWARRLVGRYTADACPDTGLPAYLYNASYRPSRADGSGERIDRAASQLGAQLSRAVEERSVWMPNQARDALYCFIALLEMSAATGEPAFAHDAVQSLRAFARHVFDADDGLLHPVLTDGTRLTGLVLAQDGYFGAQGTRLEGRAAGPVALLAFACGYRHTPDPTLWQACRAQAMWLKLGDLGSPGGAGFEPNARCASSEPMALLALLALHQATGRAAFLTAAERVGDNLLAKRLRAGLFAVPGKAYARIDALEPLALLQLAQALEGGTGRVPVWCGGRGRFHAHFDGHGRTTDTARFYG